MSLADALCAQSWSTLGQNECYLSHNIGASSCKEVMSERIASLLELYLEAACRKRRFGDNDRSKKAATSHPCQISNDSLLSAQVKSAIRLYVTRIASMYRGVRYHSFEHASHVSLAANKLMLCIHEGYKGGATNRQTSCRQQYSHKRKDGLLPLATDPMLHFAMVFAGLIHDVDHHGVPNVVLVQEEHPLAMKYDNISVAERNSIDIAFSVLKEPAFDALRKAMFPNKRSSYKDFYTIVNDLVLCTDIASRERQDCCRRRFVESFESNDGDARNSCSSNTTDDTVELLQGIMENDQKMNRCFPLRGMKMRHTKCMQRWTQHRQGLLKDDSSCRIRRISVMEQMIQTADVAHCMQSWDVFLKWNARLFNELMFSFYAGRSFDPRTNWFEGQIGFFNGYIIPLAERLEQCAVFGENSGMFLELAMQNKLRWELEGKAFCDELTVEVEPNFKVSSNCPESADVSGKYTTTSCCCDDNAQ